MLRSRVAGLPCRGRPQQQLLLTPTRPRGLIPPPTSSRASPSSLPAHRPFSRLNNLSSNNNNLRNNPTTRPSSVSSTPTTPKPTSSSSSSSSPSPLAQQRRTLRTSQRAAASPQFEPLRPPAPSSLGRPRAARSYRRGRRWGRRLAVAAAVLGAAWAADRTLCASGVARSLRTFGAGLAVALDYKLNFREEPLLGGTIEDLHRRSAERLFEVLHSNGGLYLKIGQAIAMQSAVLPPEFQRMFARMFDDAPQDEWRDVEKVIRQDFGGRSAEEVFGVSFTGEKGKGLLERKARASASVAQVHWARLPDGREVAIKIQKPEIAKQVGWDLWAFR